MTDEGDQNAGIPPEENAPAPVPPAVPQRAASMTLRETDTASEQAASLMDPANQALADALKITYRLLQLAMVVLGVLYIFSGFQPIREGERGVALRFGKQTGGLLDPGFRFSFPAPLGEMITVDTGNRDMDLRRDFWVYVQPGDENRPDDSLSNSLKLNPARDNSLVTADQNIAHTQWLALYRIEDPAAYAQNMIPEKADQIIRASLQSAIIRAVAETPIDDLLKQTEGEQGSIATRVRVIAQETLNQIDSGVRIQQLSLDRKIPPPYLLDEFNRVQSALANANRKETEARSGRDTVLNAAAGKVAPALVDLIDSYEAAVELGEDAESERIYARIGDVMEGREILTIDGVPERVSGQVTQIISEARSMANEIASQAEAEAEYFQAKLAQFDINPRVMMYRDWVDAYVAFLDSSVVETMILPVGASTEVLINADPQLAKQIESDRRRRQAEDARERRRELLFRESNRADGGRGGS